MSRQESIIHIQLVHEKEMRVFAKRLQAEREKNDEQQAQLAEYCASLQTETQWLNSVLAVEGTCRLQEGSEPRVPSGRNNGWDSISVDGAANGAARDHRQPLLQTLPTDPSSPRQDLSERMRSAVPEEQEEALSHHNGEPCASGPHAGGSGGAWRSCDIPWAWIVAAVSFLWAAMPGGASTIGLERVQAVLRSELF